MSSDARLMCGLTLVLVPTIVYGGLTVLNVITNGMLGTPGPRKLSESQVAFYRAGHAHAGVLTLSRFSFNSRSTAHLFPRPLSGRFEQAPLRLQFWCRADFLQWRMCGRCVSCFMRAQFWWQLLRSPPASV